MSSHRGSLSSTVPDLPGVSPIPPLESGDRLTRREFERRYHAMPGGKKAELIEGIVYMPSPVRYESHAKPHIMIAGLIAVYLAATPGTSAGDNATVRLDADNEVQPDAFLFITEECGGRVHLADDDYLDGAPELIVEVAASSVSYDLHDKLKAYRRNEVLEYVVWRVRDGQLDWFRLIEGEYKRIRPDDEGIIRSEAFPGLDLDVAALLNGDLARVLTVLNQGIQTNDHAAFVERLARRAAEKTSKA